MVFGDWIQEQKTIFLVTALSLIVFSFGAAIHEKIKKGKNTGLIGFSIALMLSASVFGYNKIKYGYFFI
ncbi:MAG TPA: hypothetical protein VKA08_03675 [Balneolales bacterium]|nr:hypothetical protein [Balneolales bacterium]